MQLLEHEMKKEIRKTGIDIIGDAPWGTHFCQFYETKEDLVDVLVPYFKAGLKNNEFCMWVTSEPLSENEAKEAMRKVVPNFDRYLKRGQIEIVPHTEWYLKGGVFNLQRVLDAWIGKLDQALAEGYGGLRVTGNTAWLEKNDWRSFVDYEEEVNNVIGKYRMMTICTYSLDKCGASEVIDVVRNHQFALIRRRGEWELIESSGFKRTKEALRESEEKYRNLLENARDTIMTLDLQGNITFINSVVEEYGFKKDEVVGKNMAEFVPEKYQPKLIKDFAKVIRGNPAEGEIEIITPKGKIISEYRSSPIKRGNKVIGSQTILRDITKRKRAEEALRESEEKFRNIFESASDCMIYLDRYGRILDVNGKAVEVFGGSKKELVGKHFTRVGVISPRDIPMVMSAFAKALAGKKPVVDTWIKNKKGQEIYVEVSGSLMELNGEPGMFVIARDVTERKQMEEKLRESEERFRNLFESIDDPVGVYVGREGRLIEYNEAFKRVSGYTDEELKDKTFLDLVHPDDQAIVLEKYRTKYSEEELPRVYELRSVAKNEKIIPVEISVSTYKVKDKVVGIEVIHRDITKRKQMEEKLRQYSEHLEELVQKRTQELLESEKRYSVLVEEASDGVGMVQDGKIVFVNKRGAEIVGYSKNELIGLPLEKLVDEKYRQFIKEVATGRLRGEKVPETVEFEALTKNNEHVLVEAHGTLMHYQGRPALFAILRDISARKRMEEQRLKLEKLATIGELATMVGHDLRNPLQAIENATYYLNNELPRLPLSTPIPQKTLEMLQIINNSVNYADKIIRDLHDFSSVKKPTLKKTNINNIVKENLSQVEAPENVELITELSHLPKIKADKDMIKRVFLNLAINGIQAMEKGGTLRVSTKKTRGFVEVSFKDTGAGIPKENLKKLFTPFFTTRAKGMGMGLPICKKFVEAHGGSIEVESKEGKGSTFKVKLPIQQENGGENE